MARLILLNGSPGIGKSTLARRYADEHPGVLDCDIDLLRRMLGGWEDEDDRAGALIRPVALAMITAHLAGGHDVVLPQLLARIEELRRFEGAAQAAGADFVECQLTDDLTGALARFHHRGATSTSADHQHAARVVAASGGDGLLGDYPARLEALAAQRPATLLIRSVVGDIEQTYRCWIDLLGPRS